MEGEAPFVITVASEKGGVGKTTLALNLAVYLKALREDMAVTVASFDNHFSVDGMFAIGPRRGGTVAGLFAGESVPDLARLGEYGVQFLPSERELQAPDGDINHLRRTLSRSGLQGVLILDTRPILDYFTRNALRAADLVLAPVKDRASLVNVAALRKTLGAEESEDRLWVVPSLVDARLKLREGIGVADFLTLAARERGYRVLDTWISKSPKVEGLATGFSGRIHPVLTRARTTAVHRQYREIASFVLEKFENPDRVRRPAFDDPPDEERLPPGKTRNLVSECPLCRKDSADAIGHYFLHLRSRRRGMAHRACLRELFESSGVEVPESGYLAILETPEENAGAMPPLLHFFDGEGEVLARGFWAGDRRFLRAFLEGASGRGPEEWFREAVFVALNETRLSGFISGEAGEEFTMVRRKAFRAAAGREKAGRQA